MQNVQAIFAHLSCPPFPVGWTVTTSTFYEKWGFVLVGKKKKRLNKWTNHCYTETYTTLPEVLMLIVCAPPFQGTIVHTSPQTLPLPYLQQESSVHAAVLFTWSLPPLPDALESSPISQKRRGMGGRESSETKSLLLSWPKAQNPQCWAVWIYMQWCSSQWSEKVFWRRKK